MRSLWVRFFEWGDRHFETDGAKRLNQFINGGSVFLALAVLGFAATEILVAFFGDFLGWPAAQGQPVAYKHLLICHLPVALVVFGAMAIRNTMGKTGAANSILVSVVVIYSAYLSISEPFGWAILPFPLTLLVFITAARTQQHYSLTILQIAVITAGIFFVITADAILKLAFPQSLSRQILSGVAAAYLVFFIVRTLFFFSRYSARFERQFLFEAKLRQQLITTMIPELQRSEQRYSHLVEDAAEIIFSLNEAYEIKLINRTVKKLLQHEPSKLVGQKIDNLIFSHGDVGLDKRLFEENLRGVMVDKETRDFRVGLKHRHNPEPVTMRMVLSYNESEGECEILGKAYPLTEDRLIGFLESEKSVYLMDNSLRNAEDLSRHLTRNLSKCMNAADLTTLRVGLREILVNAIEHGNLNMSFDEKTQSQLEGRYFDFINERMVDKRYAERRVRVEHVHKRNFVAFRITDEGSGFDHRLFVREEGGFQDTGLEHGRGIFMTRSAFDKVQYVQPGNKVILIKRFEYQ